jgi:transposase
MVEGTVGSHHKEGSRKMGKRTIVCAGIDTGKRKLDAAINGRPGGLQVDNTAEGHDRLLTWLRQHQVKRIGIEASGGYEQEVVRTLRRKGFVVVVFQPAQVRAYAQFVGQLAKNDKIDANLIAECTAAVKTIHAAPDPRLAPFAEHLTMIEQIGDSAAHLKTRLETCREPRIRAFWKAEIGRLEKIERAELKQLVAAIRQHADLAERLELIDSVRGVGLPTATAILVRLPEIGTLTREEVAALAGLAPYDDDSGISGAAASGCEGRSIGRPCPHPCAGIPSSSRSTSASSPTERNTRPRSSPAPASCSSMSTPLSRAASLGWKRRPT